LNNLKKRARKIFESEHVQTHNEEELKDLCVSKGSYFSAQIHFFHAETTFIMCFISRRLEKLWNRVDVLWNTFSFDGLNSCFIASFMKFLLLLFIKNFFIYMLTYFKDRIMFPSIYYNLRIFHETDIFGTFTHILYAFNYYNGWNWVHQLFVFCSVTLDSYIIIDSLFQEL